MHFLYTKEVIKNLNPWEFGEEEEETMQGIVATDPCILCSCSIIYLVSALAVYLL